jgi:hypothetical protein
MDRRNFCVQNPSIAQITVILICGSMGTPVGSRCLRHSLMVLASSMPTASPDKINRQRGNKFRIFDKKVI